MSTKMFDCSAKTSHMITNEFITQSMIYRYIYINEIEPKTVNSVQRLNDIVPHLISKNNRHFIKSIPCLDTTKVIQKFNSIWEAILFCIYSQQDKYE